MVSETFMKKYINRADMLIEALPYIQQWFGKTVVVKYGGAAMQEQALSQKIMEDLTLLKFVGIHPILVHGGGPEINRTLDALSIESTFVDGLRVTNADTMEVVQMVLTGKINKDIVAGLNGMKAQAVGICGIDGQVIEAEKSPPVNGTDLGQVGRITRINTQLLLTLSKNGYIPVIAPIGVGEDGESYNINADIVAGRIAAELQAEKLVFLTDTDGIRQDEHDPSTLLSTITGKEIRRMIENGSIAGGMLPKVESCLSALAAGVTRTHILNGTIPHPLILELFTDSGIGTMVIA